MELVGSCISIPVSSHSRLFVRYLTMKFTFFIFIFLAASEFIKCAEILAVIPSPFFSHQATFRPLWRELAKRGHKITLLSAYPMEHNENITQIDYSKTYEETPLKEMFKGDFNVFKIVRKFLNTFDSFMTSLFSHPDLLELVNNNKTFDLMMVELIMPGWPLLSVKFKCPFIGLSTMDGHQEMHAAVGNAIHPVLYPYADLGIGENPSITDKLKSIALTIGQEIFSFVMSPIVTNYLRSSIDKDLPDVREVLKNSSMIFVNSNPIFFPPRPITPVTINLGGGLHLTEPKKLPEDLQKYLDEAKDGCIYVSFGTTVNSEYLTDEQKEIFVQVFKEMTPMRILWKFDDVNAAKNAKNVEVRTWIPQQDVLRHPNVKLFVTQGGLQSMEEAINCAVPMVGMPFFGDQFNNVLKMSRKEFGYSLTVKDMNKNSLKSAIEEVLSNPKYKKNIHKFSAIFKDQIMGGLEKAVWWTEYLLRHGGTEHLRSPSADIPLYQYFFLDVIFAAVVSLWLLYRIIKYICQKMIKLARSLLNRPKPKKD